MIQLKKYVHDKLNIASFKIDTFLSKFEAKTLFFKGLMNN